MPSPHCNNNAEIGIAHKALTTHYMRDPYMASTLLGSQYIFDNNWHSRPAECVRFRQKQMANNATYSYARSIHSTGSHAQCRMSRQVEREWGQRSVRLTENVTTLHTANSNTSIYRKASHGPHVDITKEDGICLREPSRVNHCRLCRKG